MHFDHYVALGDSISIDAYPALDHQEHSGGAQPLLGLGAAALLHRNADAVFPEFAGRDLATAFPGIETEPLAFDGATTEDTLLHELPQIAAPADAPALVTVTAGGNDLLGLLWEGDREAEAGVAAALERLARIVARVRQRLPRATVLVGTVYDPTDGTGVLDGGRLPEERMRLLARYNDGVRALADPRRGVRLADIHARFLGHGAAAPPAERWYWRHSSIEPGMRGASELRRLWLETIGLAG